MPAHFCPHCNEEFPMLGDAFCSYCREPLVDMSESHESQVERLPAPPKKDYGFADAQFANQLVDQGVPDEDVLSKLNERGVSEKHAQRFIDEAKGSRKRRDLDKQYSTTKRLGMTLVTVGFLLSVGGLIFLQGRFFRVGLAMLITGAVLLTPKLDIRR